MDRKSFLKNIALLGASSTLLNAEVAPKKAKKPAKKAKPTFKLDKKIFKLGQNEITVKIPPEYKEQMATAVVRINDEDGFWPNDPKAKWSVDGDNLKVSVNFTVEGRHTIAIFPDKKERNQKKALGFVQLFAVAPDLYELRPYKGDSHIHTTNSDGANKPVDVALRCYEVGLDYQAISDHRRWDTSDDMKKLFEKYPTSMSFYHCEECHYTLAHVQNFGGRESLTLYVKNHMDEYKALSDKFASTLPKDLDPKMKKYIADAEAEFAIIRKLGGIAVMNHPYWLRSSNALPTYNQPIKVTDIICERGNFDAYEYVNYASDDVSTGMANAKYTELTEAGKRFPVIGTSDAHNVKTQGYGYTVVFAKSEKFEDIKQAILKRNSVAVTVSKRIDTEKVDYIPFGDRRLVNYSYFLFKEYFSAHDKLVAEEGKILKDIIKNGENEERLKKLKAASAKVESLWKSILG